MLHPRCIAVAAAAVVGGGGVGVVPVVVAVAGGGCVVVAALIAGVAGVAVGVSASWAEWRRGGSSSTRGTRTGATSGSTR
eukprot:4357331-Pyramimonas_sp.AAC.1